VTPRRAGRAARLALLATALCVALFVAELSLRRFDLPAFDACSATADFAIPDDELGFAPPPGGVVAGEPLNALGLRGPVPAEPKPADRFRILFLGDSTAWGLGLPLDRTFAARSTQLLGEAHPERAFEFLIGAFPGYSSYQSKILLGRLLPLSPDLAVLYVGARNDSTRHRYFEDADIPARRARLQAAWHRVRLLRLGEALWDRLHRSLFRKLLTYEARARVPLDAFRANVADILRQLERARVPALVVVPPFSEKLTRREPLAPAYREALREIARERGVPTVSLQAVFDRADPAGLYFEDGYHFDAGGHALAAEAIREAVEEHRLVGR